MPRRSKKSPDSTPTENPELNAEEILQLKAEESPEAAAVPEKTGPEKTGEEKTGQEKIGPKKKAARKKKSKTAAAADSDLGDSSASETGAISAAFEAQLDGGQLDEIRLEREVEAQAESPAVSSVAEAEVVAAAADTFEQAYEEMERKPVPEPVLAEPDAGAADPVARQSEIPGQLEIRAESAAADEAEDASFEPEPGPQAKLERLQKILSRAGIASRRHAEELITEGRVQVNGKVVTELGSKADAGRDHIRVDGKLLQGAERLRYFILNKPKGYVTTVSDPEGRPTVMEFFSKMRERLYPVGRLDYQSEGLLLVTNDGDLANKLTMAATGVAKTYLVKVSGRPSEEELDLLREGVSIDRTKPGEGKVRTAAAEIREVRQGDNPWYEVVLIEGRNRELRKMFEEIGHFVEKIRRVGYGPLVLDQEPGHFRELEPEELVRLRQAAEGKWRQPKTRSNARTAGGREARSDARPGRPEQRPSAPRSFEAQRSGTGRSGQFAAKTTRGQRPPGKAWERGEESRSARPAGERSRSTGERFRPTGGRPEQPAQGFESRQRPAGRPGPAATGSGRFGQQRPERRPESRPEWKPEDRGSRQSRYNAPSGTTGRGGEAYRGTGRPPGGAASRPASRPTAPTGRTQTPPREGPGTGRFGQAGQARFSPSRFGPSKSGQARPGQARPGQTGPGRGPDRGPVRGTGGRGGGAAGRAYTAGEDRARTARSAPLRPSENRPKFAAPRADSRRPDRGEFRPSSGKREDTGRPYRSGPSGGRSTAGSGGRASAPRTGSSRTPDRRSGSEGRARPSSRTGSQSGFRTGSGTGSGSGSRTGSPSRSGSGPKGGSRGQGGRPPQRPGGNRPFRPAKKRG